MKKILIIILFLATLNAQDSIKVARSDLIEFRNTIEVLDSTNQKLLNLQEDYEKISFLYNDEIKEFKHILKTDSLMLTYYDEKIILQNEKIKVYKDELTNKKIEIWIWRSLVATITGIILFK